MQDLSSNEVAPASITIYPVKKWYHSKEAEELLTIPGHYYQLQYKRGFSLLGFWTTQWVIDRTPDIEKCDENEQELLSSLDTLYSTPIRECRANKPKKEISTI